MNLRRPPQSNLIICWLALLVFLPAPWPAAAQSTSSSSPKTTITLTTRLVYVDVVVRDSGGHSVAGLTKEDFSVKEEGKPQAITFFLDNVATSAPLASPPVLATAPGAQSFSNVGTLGGSDHAANIILLDLLNTPVADQPYAVKQLIQFLKALPPGHQMALFLLTDRLQMLQGFTGNSDLLAAAAGKLDAENLRLTRSGSERMQMIDVMTNFANAIGRNPANLLGHMMDDMRNEDALNLEQRMRITGNAFAELARAASGYPGRKNLLWLAENFPVGMAAQLQLDRSPLAFDVLDTTDLIANLQIAIYPISLAGLETEGVGAAANGVGEVSLMTGGHTLDDQFNTRNAMYYAMNDLARASGGEAFHGSNDIAGALARVVDDDAHFYTLAYRSTNTNWDGSYRSIAVSLARKGYHLSYRRGYFATPAADGTHNIAEELQAALQPGMLDSSQLRIRTAVAPSGSGSVVAIDAAVDPADLTYSTDQSGHKQTQLLVSMFAFGRADQTKPVAQSKAVLNVNLDPAQYAAILKTGLRFRQQLALKPGEYQLRLGVAETGSHHIGTLEMPIRIAEAPQAGRGSAR